MKTITDEKLESILRRRIDQVDLAMARPQGDRGNQWSDDHLQGQRLALEGMLWFFEDHSNDAIDNSGKAIHT